MAAIPGVRFDITGASGSQGLLGPKGSWRAYVFPRGANASQDSTGTLITFDSAAIASRFTSLNWVQVGLSTANIRQVTGVGGNSISINTAVTVSENGRIFLIGNTEPTVSGGSATYTTPNTLVRQRGDDTADLYTNSMITTDSNGLVQFYAAPNMYDVMIQDGNQANQGHIADLEVGTVEGVSVIDPAFFGSTVTFSGVITGISVSGGISASTTLLVGQTANITALLTETTPWFNVKHRDYGALGDGSTNDASAIQAAIDAAGTAAEGVVFFPAGIYQVGSTLELKAGVRLVGIGPTSSSTNGSTIRLANSVNADIIRSEIAQDGTGTNHYTGLENLNIDGNKSNNTSGDGLSIGGRIGEYFAVRRVRFVNCANSGINVLRGTNGLGIFDGIQFFTNGSTGSDSGFRYLRDSGDITQLWLKNISGDDNQRALIYIDNNGGGGGSVNIANVKSEKNTSGVQDDCIVLARMGGSQVTIDNVWSDGLGADPEDAVIRVTGETGSCRLRWSNIRAQSPGTTNIIDDEITPLTLAASATGQADAAFGENFTSGGYGAIFRGTSNSNIVQAASLTLPAGYFFGVSGTIGAGTSISNMTQTQGRNIVLWAAAGTMGFSNSNTLRVIGNSINVPANGAVQAFCTGTTWFVFSPSS